MAITLPRPPWPPYKTRAAIIVARNPLELSTHFIPFNDPPVEVATDILDKDADLFSSSDYTAVQIHKDPKYPTLNRGASFRWEDKQFLIVRQSGHLHILPIPALDFCEPVQLYWERAKDHQHTEYNSVHRLLDKRDQHPMGSAFYEQCQSLRQASFKNGPRWGLLALKIADAVQQLGYQINTEYEPRDFIANPYPSNAYPFDPY